eukprot:6294617-Amphidinium_carterae.3
MHLRKPATGPSQSIEPGESQESSSFVELGTTLSREHGFPDPCTQLPLSNFHRPSCYRGLGDTLGELGVPAPQLPHSL